jgi:hypothetical protein
LNKDDERWRPTRRKQTNQKAALIRQWRPWEKSTGARTPEGAAASSRNAYKGGLRQEMRELSKSVNAMLREQREGLKRV